MRPTSRPGNAIRRDRLFGLLLLWLPRAASSEDDAEEIITDDSCLTDGCENGGRCLLGPNGEGTCDCMPGYDGNRCEHNVDNCFGACLHNGTCTDGVDGYSCECAFGYAGHSCEEPNYFTMQQFSGHHCGHGQPNRCFRLQLDRCTDTGIEDIVLGQTHRCHGILRYSMGLYSISFCWSVAPDDGSTLAADDEELCHCGNSGTHFMDLPRFGSDGLGPSTPGLHDSKWCHPLFRMTRTRMVNSTGMPDHLFCAPALATRSTMPLATTNVILLLMFFFAYTPAFA